MYNFRVKTLEILLLALGLSMDAFAVSIASGATLKKMEIKSALKMALFFGGFQTLMPVAGWAAGLGMKGFIAGWDHWLAFGLLSFVGIKMIVEAAEERPEDGRKARPFETGTLFLLAVATSIDALAVGVTFSLLGVSILAPVLVIGAVTFSFSAAGVLIGVKSGHFFENRVEIAGGIVLIAIGLRILLSHLFG